MALILSLSANYPTIQRWRPLYLILTVIIVCSQKVDTTLSKGVLRIAASVAGGLYGEHTCCHHICLAMLRPADPGPASCQHALLCFVLTLCKYAVHYGAPSANPPNTSFAPQLNIHFICLGVCIAALASTALCHWSLPSHKPHSDVAGWRACSFIVDCLDFMGK